MEFQVIITEEEYHALLALVGAAWSSGSDRVERDGDIVFSMLGRLRAENERGAEPTLEDRIKMLEAQVAGLVAFYERFTGLPFVPGEGAE